MQQTYLFGMKVDAIIGKTYFDLNFPFAPGLQQDVRQVIEANKIIHGEFAHAFGSGSAAPRRFEYVLAPVVGEDKQVESIVVISRDITERKAAEEEAWQHSNFDQMTGLANRRLFNNRLEQDIKHSQRSGKSVGLLFIDLDHFKEVNDSLGHDAGDILLKQTAERINSCVRSMDTVARLGGDEFTVNGYQKARNSGGKGCRIRSCIGRARGCWKEPEGRLKTPHCFERLGWPTTGSDHW